MLLVIAGFALGNIGAGIGISLAVLWVIAVTMVMAALSSIFQTALYLHATEQSQPGGYFDPTQFQQAFTPKAATTP